MEEDWFIHESFQSMGPKLIPSAVLTGSEGEEKSISEMRKKMDTRDELIPLAAMMGLCWR